MAMRVTIKDDNGNHRSGIYSYVRLGDSVSSYRLSYASFSGENGWKMTNNLENGAPFYAKDVPLDSGLGCIGTPEPGW